MNKTQQILNEIFTNIDTTDLLPSEFVAQSWEYYQVNCDVSNSLNGYVFEGIIMMALAQENISPIYEQVELTYVNHAIFDIFLYSEEMSYALSLKTSLRERWKQADLEGLALKQVHKKSKNYILTLSDEEVQRRRNDDVDYHSLDGFILADTPEFDELVSELRQREFEVAGTVTIIKHDRQSHTYDTLRNLYNLD